MWLGLDGVIRPQVTSLKKRQKIAYPRERRRRSAFGVPPSPFVSQPSLPSLHVVTDYQQLAQVSQIWRGYWDQREGI